MIAAPSELPITAIPRYPIASQFQARPIARYPINAIQCSYPQSKKLGTAKKIPRV
jgi:hypothetical protein